MAVLSARSFLLSLPAAAALVWCCPSTAQGQTIFGSLSNFDCENETDDDCDEFDVELHGPHPEDVYHTYTNGNYGSPVVMATSGGTLIRYQLPRHRTLPGTIEHFGITLRNFNADPTPSFTWKHDGVVAGSNPHPLQPQIVTETGFSTEGDPVLIEKVTNIDPYNRRMWIKRSVSNVAYAVTLEQLMPNDPLVLDSQDIDAGPVLLNVGQSVSYDQLEIGDGIASAVINYDIFRDKIIFSQHTVGDFNGSVMNAVVLSTSACSDGGLVILTNPQDVTGVPGDDVDFDASVDNNGDAGPVTFQWFHEGVEIPDSDADSITIHAVRNADAGSYYCQATNECGVVITTAARLTLPLPCPSDYDGDGFVTGDDFDSFVADFVDGFVTADFDADGFVTGDDFDGYVSAFESGC